MFGSRKDCLNFKQHFFLVNLAGFWFCFANFRFFFTRCHKIGGFPVFGWSKKMFFLGEVSWFLADVRFVLDSFLIFFARVCNLISYLELRAVCMQKGVLIVSAGFVGIFISEDSTNLDLDCLVFENTPSLPSQHDIILVTPFVIFSCFQDENI